MHSAATHSATTHSANTYHTNNHSATTHSATTHSAARNHLACTICTLQHRDQLLVVTRTLGTVGCTSALKQSRVAAAIAYLNVVTFCQCVVLPILRFTYGALTAMHYSIFEPSTWCGRHVYLEVQQQRSRFCLGMHLRLCPRTNPANSNTSR